MKIGFYARKGSSKSALIYARITEGRGRQFRLATNYSLKSIGNWNSDLQRVRTVNSEPTSILINLQLGKLKAFLEQAYIGAKAESKSTGIGFYKKALIDFGNVVERKSKVNVKNPSIGQCFDAFIVKMRNAPEPKSGKRLRMQTLNAYSGTKNLIVHFRMDKTPVASINSEWKDEFVQRCEKGGYNGKPSSMNTIGKHIKHIKRIIHQAVEDGLQADEKEIRNFVVFKEDVDDIYLSVDELSTMEYANLEHMSELHDRSRDLFLIGAFTGLRFSDFNALQKSNLVNLPDGTNAISIRSQKTGKKVTIPIHPVVARVLRKYGGVPPLPVADQNLNRCLKEIGEVVGLYDVILRKRTIGGVEREEKYLKFQLLKSHTARRSFCTNAYLAGMDSIAIMTISGHTTEKNFLRYIKVTSEEHAMRMAKHRFFNELPLSDDSHRIAEATHIE